MNINEAVMLNRQESEHAQRLEQLRRQGHDFIKVVYKGNNPVPQYDGSGNAINLRIKEVHDAILFEQLNPETGANEYKTRLGTRELAFHMEESTGDCIAHVLDNDYNRHFLASIMDFGVEPLDPLTKAEINDLIGEVYEVEVGRKEGIARQMKELQKELDGITKKEVDTKARDAEIQVKRTNKRGPKRAELSDALNAQSAQQEQKSGNNESVLDLD